MPQRSGPPPGRTPRPGPSPLPRPSVPGRDGRDGNGLRDRLKRDTFLFLFCLGALAFVTWGFALTWWLTGGVVLLVLALASLAPALLLFYLRDA
jgi:hypothetical protein